MATIEDFVEWRVHVSKDGKHWYKSVEIYPGETVYIRVAVRPFDVKAQRGIKCRLQLVTNQKPQTCYPAIDLSKCMNKDPVDCACVKNQVPHCKTTKQCATRLWGIKAYYKVKEPKWYAFIFKWITSRNDYDKNAYETIWIPIVWIGIDRPWIFDVWGGRSTDAKIVIKHPTMKPIEETIEKHIKETEKTLMSGLSLPLLLVLMLIVIVLIVVLIKR